MKRLLCLPLFYLLLAAASCPGPEPFDCDLVERMDERRAAGAPAPFYRVADSAADRYIVTLRPGWAEGLADSSPGGVEAELTDLADGYGASDVLAYAATRQFSCSLTAEQLKRLRADDRVLFVEQDGVKRVTPLAGTGAESWGLDRIDQRDLPLDGDFDPDGSGFAVHAYVIDTGVDRDHPEFDGRLGEAFSSFGDSRDDDDGHGTHVAGTVGGATFGVARQVIVHPVRVLRNGQGSDSSVIKGIDWATAHAEANGWPAVANMSLGGDTSRSLDTAVCRSLAAGVTHVVAAGNDRDLACSKSPAHVKQAITVGASDRRDRTASFSNQGECVDVFAPGVDIRSAWSGGGRRTISGTSMASPHVAGVAALILERRPAATAAEIKSELLANSTPGVVRDLRRDTTDRLVYAKEQ